MGTAPPPLPHPSHSPVSPPGFEGEAGGVASVAPQGAERPGDQLGAGVVDVPQVDVLVGDLHHALPVDVQVGTGQEEHVEALCGGRGTTGAKSGVEILDLGWRPDVASWLSLCVCVYVHYLCVHTALQQPGGPALPY